MKVKDKERIDRIIQVFNDTKLNQRQFAELIGVSQQLVSSVVTYTKKPNETILFAIIDNFSNVDPMWLFTGVGKYNNDYVPQHERPTPLVFHINNIIEKRFEELSGVLLQRISSIEGTIKEDRAKNLLRRIDQDNSNLQSTNRKDKGQLGS
jgi:DNA-binding XRE family transcriptional regulator